MIDVLIVGAGPVGLTLANELVRFGLDVRIIDKAPTRTDKSKAVAVWSRTLELFDGAGIADDLVAAGNRVRSAHITTGSAEIARIDFEGLATPYPFSLMVPQSETERVLEAHLSARGVTVERRAELQSFADGPAGIEAAILRPDGGSETVSARWLVGCDGAHSTVRHALGLQFTGNTVAATFLLADIRLAGAGLDSSEIRMIWHRSGIVAIFPLPGGRTRLIASLPAPGTDAEPGISDVQALLDERAAGLVASDPVWIAEFRINERKVDRYRTGHVFLAGDAAHIHSPAGGQGMNTGMQDAINLGWKLALVAKGSAGPALLDSYDAERGPIAEAVIADAGRLTGIAMLANPHAQAARDFLARHLLGIAAIRHAAAEQLAELTVAYPESPINGPHFGGAAPKPGQRLPPAAGTDMAAAASTAPRFAVYAAGTGKPADHCGGHADLLEPALRPPVDPRVLLLVRPDGYVAMSARAGDWPAVAAYLDGLS